MPTPRKSAPARAASARSRPVARKPARRAAPRAAALDARISFEPPVAPEAVDRLATSLGDRLAKIMAGPAPDAGGDAAPARPPKPRFELLPPRAEREIAAVFTHGAAKYDERGWTRGVDVDAQMGAALRHLNAFKAGEMLDRQSGLFHVAHAAARLMVLLEGALCAPRPDTGG